MLFSNLDSIVRRGLLENGLPIHYYAELLFHSATCLREQSFDTLKIINYATLPVDSYGAITLPDDFVDDLGVFISAAGGLIEVPKQDAINPIRVHNPTTGIFEPNTAGVQLLETSTINFWGVWGTWYWNVDSYNEPTGRFFGSQGGTQAGYKLVKERRQIQLTYGFIDSSVVLAYISDGQSIDAATQVDTLAFQTIRAWQEWKKSPNRNDDNSPEGRSFYNQRRLLRARLNDLTLTDLRNIIRNQYYAAPKN